MQKVLFYRTILLLLLAFSLNARGQNAQHTNTDQIPEFKPSGKIWGYVFGDYFLKLHADEFNRGNTQYSNMQKNFNAFAFRRVYLGYDFQISEKFSTQLLLANENDNADASGERTVFIKAANIRWKNFLPNNDLVIGQTATPLFALVSESVWGYRNIEKTVADMRHFGSSNDLGISLQGRLNEQGNFGYNFMLANGTSQRPENNRYKKFYYEVYAKLMDQKVILDFTGDYEKAGGGRSITTFKGFAAYKTPPVTIGIEAVTQTRKAATQDITNGPGNATDLNISPFAVSVFVHGPIINDKLNYFARFDNFNPDTRFDPNIIYSTNVATAKENFITAGIDWMPVKNVHLEPNIWFDSFNSMENNVSGNEKSDYDLTGRITFYYIFR